MTMSDFSSLPGRLVRRRDFVRAAAGLGAASLAAWARPQRLLGQEPVGNAAPSRGTRRRSVDNAVALGDRLVEWQSPYGGPDPAKCPHRSRKKFNPGLLHGVGPATRALYRLHAETGAAEYKVAADGYAVFLMATLHEPLTPYTNRITLGGEERHLMSAAWLYGKALSPCYEWFVKHNAPRGSQSPGCFGPIASS
jgi:hypothetical protein